jgi:hypothetical protein
MFLPVFYLGDNQASKWTVFFNDEEASCWDGFEMRIFLYLLYLVFLL